MSDIHHRSDAGEIGAPPGPMWLYYKVDNKIVYSQMVVYGWEFALIDTNSINDIYMKSRERVFTGWEYNGKAFEAGIWKYKQNVTVTATFSTREYTLVFSHSSDNVAFDVAFKDVHYGEDISDTLESMRSRINTYIDTSYQKFVGWKLQDGSTECSWKNLVKSANLSPGSDFGLPHATNVIPIKAVIEPRFKIVVYKNRKWVQLTPVACLNNVSRGTLEWRALWTKINK